MRSSTSRTRTNGSIVVLVAALLVPLVAGAQPEIVPAEHDIYDFLHQQWVAGRLPAYRHEMRPHDRQTIIRHLDSLQVYHEDLRSSGRFWLRHYRQEFLEPDAIRETVLGHGRLNIPSGRDTRKYLFHQQSENWRVAVHGAGSMQSRYAEDTFTGWGHAFVPEVRLSGNFRGRVGFYSGTLHGYQFIGDTRVMDRDPTFGNLYLLGGENIPTWEFSRTTASLRLGADLLFAELANERLLIGPGFGSSIIMGSAADYFPFARIGLKSSVVSYELIHGSLASPARQVFPNGDRNNPIRVAPQRHVGIHRFSVHPTHNFRLAFSEIVVYGLRGIELAYLNPLYPYAVSEVSLQDRDNVISALDFVYRPVPALELYGTVLVDDFNFPELGDHSYNVKVATQTGLGFTLGGSTLGWVSYTRINPYVYTHRFRRNGVFYNSYQHNGFTLGHPMGPNTDQLAVGLRHWFAGRVKASLYLHYRRRGESFLNDADEEVNVGGDPVNGLHPPFEEHSKKFLAGARFSGPGAQFEMSWEPIRDLGVALHLSYQDWIYHGIVPLHGKDDVTNESMGRVPDAPASTEVFGRLRLYLDL